MESEELTVTNTSIAAAVDAPIALAADLHLGHRRGCRLEQQRCSFASATLVLVDPKLPKKRWRTRRRVRIVQRLAIDESASRLGCPPAESHRIDNRCRPTDGIAAGKEPLDTRLAGHRIGLDGVTYRGFDNAGRRSEELLPPGKTQHQQHHVVARTKLGQAQISPQPDTGSHLDTKGINDRKIALTDFGGEPPLGDSMGQTTTDLPFFLDERHLETGTTQIVGGHQPSRTGSNHRRVG